jgi:hypothetical protein
MSHYGILLPGFWDGETGRAIADLGGRDAQLVALYLMSNQDATMIGLYRARLSIVRERIGTLPAKALERALVACGEAKFADYDVATEHVWVREMAKFRLGLLKGPLDRKDKRAIGAARLYDKLPPNPFLGPFFKRYRTDLHLSKARVYRGAWERLGSPFDGPPKPVIESGSDLSNQITGDQGSVAGEDQQADQKPRADARDSHRVLLKFAHEVLEQPDATTVDEGELCNRIKDKAAAGRIVYDGRACQKALDAARGTRARRAG